MPVLMSPDIAAKFKEKWLSVYPEDHQHHQRTTDPVHLDDSLTSLNWLQNFCILSADPPEEERWNGVVAGCPSSSLCLRRLGFPQGSTDSPSSPPAGDTAATGMPLYLGSPVTSGSDVSTDPRTIASCYAQTHLHLPLQPSPPLEVDYKTNPRVKPPYSYASLICMAMQASKQPKVTLSTIYNWITENFCYYRHAEPSWQNSIRHNLSLNKCFMKVPRQKDEPGKGGFWQIDPQYADMFVNGIFKRRRMSANHYNSSSNGHRQSKLLQGHDTVGYHRSQNGCLYQGEVGMSTKRKHLSTKCHSDRNHNKVARMIPKSPLLATEAHGADMLRGDFDLASVFDDVLGGNCSNFEDLDINTALVSLGCEMEVSSSASVVHHGHVTSMELGLQGRWCGGGGGGEGVDLQNQASNHHHQSYGYMELSGASVECHTTMGDLQMPHQQHLHQDQLLQPHHHQQHHHHPLHQFEEVSSLFLEQPEEVVVHPWGEIKEEEQVIPLTLDQGFGALCEGFFAEMQPWERVEAYL